MKSHVHGVKRSMATAGSCNRMREVDTPLYGQVGIALVQGPRGPQGDSQPIKGIAWTR